MAAWEIFQRAIPEPAAPRATLGLSGALTLNKAARDLIPGATAVELLWSAKERFIGLRPVADECDRAYRITSAGQVSLAAFTAYYGLPRGFSAAAEAQDGILLFAVPSSVEAAGE